MKLTQRTRKTGSKSCNKKSRQSATTWHVSEIDHIIINGKWRRSLQDVRVCRGADIYSDQYLVSARFKLKLHKVVPESQRRKQLDVTRLACPVTKQEFVLELRNRFSALTDIQFLDILCQKIQLSLKAIFCIIITLVTENIHHLWNLHHQIVYN